MKLETKYGNYPPEYFDVETIDEAFDIWSENEKAYKVTGIVRDDNGVIVAEFLAPYEGIYINIHDYEELENIREDYGIPAPVFKAMCEHWLNTHKDVS